MTYNSMQLQHIVEDNPCSPETSLSTIPLDNPLTGFNPPPQKLLKS